MRLNLKQYLENNKIFFEIINLVFLAAMGLIVSIVGVRIDTRNEATNKRQLEIAENDRKPYFILESQNVPGVFQGYDYVYTKDMYTVKNGGGLISGAYIQEIFTYAEITVYNHKSENMNTFSLYFDGVSEKSDGIISLYDNSKKEFVFYKYESEKFDDLVAHLRKEIEHSFPSPDGVWSHKPQMQIVCCIDLEYIDYTNTEQSQLYQFMTGDRLVLSVSDITLERNVSLGRASIDENAEDISQDVCDKIREYIHSGSIAHQRVPQPSYNLEERKADALSLAKKMISTFSYSRESLVESLSHEFSSEVVTYAVDNCGADWNELAVEQAKVYISLMGYSYVDLIDALETVEKFTPEQAIYGVDNCGADWNKQAVWAADSILLGKIMSRQELLEMLINKGFTYEQAIYGAEYNHVLSLF